MPGPTLTFAFITATLLGAFFHLLVGGDARRLALFLLAGWIGFGLGELLARTLSIEIYRIGEIHIVVASFSALIALIGSFLLSRQPPGRRQS